jgi:Mn-dependent DtxR family transcriptional regulator
MQGKRRCYNKNKREYLKERDKKMTPDEMKILKIIEAEGGESTLGRIARKMRLDWSYVRVILTSMGYRDIIDYFASGKVKITNKGWAALGKVPEPQDGLKRYLEDRARWKVFGR